jgi:hypothetical protein
MVDAYVMTEPDILKQRVTPDSVGMGSYTIDCFRMGKYLNTELGFTRLDFHLNEGKLTRKKVRRHQLIRQGHPSPDLQPPSPHPIGRGTG